MREEMGRLFGELVNCPFFILGPAAQGCKSNLLSVPEPNRFTAGSKPLTPVLAGDGIDRKRSSFVFARPFSDSLPFHGRMVEELLVFSVAESHRYQIAS
jgi:hypothetical protein